MKRIIGKQQMLGLVGAAALSMTIAMPAMAAGDTDGFAVDATNTATIVLTLSDSAENFGAVSPLGDVGTVALEGASGACYVAPVTAAVDSNAAYGMEVSASENPTGVGSSSLTIADLRISATAFGDVAGCGSATALTTTDVAFGSGGTAPGIDQASYIGLLVDWNESAGTFASTVTYTVTTS